MHVGFLEHSGVRVFIRVTSTALPHSSVRVFTIVTSTALPHYRTTTNDFLPSAPQIMISTVYL